MKLWLKTYWPVLPLVVGYAVLYAQDFLLTLNTRPFSGARFWSNMFLMTCGAIGTMLVSIFLGQLRDARALLRMVDTQARNDALSLLAFDLNEAYTQNILLQSGRVPVEVRVPDNLGDNPAQVALWHRDARRSEEKRIAKLISARESVFWGAAHVLKSWELRGLPGSHKELLAKKKHAA